MPDRFHPDQEPWERDLIPLLDRPQPSPAFDRILLERLEMMNAVKRSFRKELQWEILGGSGLLIFLGAFTALLITPYEFSSTPWNSLTFPRFEFIRIEIEYFILYVLRYLQLVKPGFFIIPVLLSWLLAFSYRWFFNLHRSSVYR